MHTCNETSLIFCFTSTGFSRVCPQNVAQWDLLKTPTELTSVFLVETKLLGGMRVPPLPLKQIKRKVLF